MNDIPPELPPSTPKPSPMLALILGFLPAALALLSITFVRGKYATDAYATLCVISVACCFISSFMLFRRKTSRALVGGILLLLLNGFIALATGCGAVMSEVNFH